MSPNTNAPKTKVLGAAALRQERLTSGAEDTKKEDKP
jgi:hypothetical protein